MALPNPNPNQQPPQFGASYQPFSVRESIGTRSSAAFLQAQSALFSRTLLRLIPGSGVLSERADLKRREMYEQKGRDPNTGRKLTKDEIAEKEARKYDRGALGEIRDLYVNEYQDSGVPVFVKPDTDAWFLLERMEIILTDIKNALTAGGMGVFSVGGNYASNMAGSSEILDPDGDPGNLTLADVPTPNDERELARQEAMDEREREDDEDQLEAEERQQGFFSKLFGSLRGKEEDSSNSLFGSVLSALSGLGSLISDLFAKYIGGMLIGKLLGGGGLGGAGGLGGRLKGVVSGAGRMIGGAGRAIGSAIAGSAAGKTFAQAGGEIAKGARATGGAIARAGSAIAGYGGKALGAVKAVGSDLLASRARSGGGFLSRAFNAVKDTATKLNPTKAITGFVSKNAGKLLKGLTSVPGLSAAISGVIGALNIRSIANDVSLSIDEKKEAIGKELGAVLGSAIGSIGGGALGSLLPIPGIGTILGTFGGGWVGEKVGEALAEAIGPRGIYDFVESIPGIGNLVAIDGDSADGKAEAKADAAAEAQKTGDQTTDPLNAETPSSAPVISTPAASMAPPPPATVPLSSGEGMSTAPMDIPSSAAENAALKTAPPIIAPTNNTVANVSNNNSATFVGPVTASRGTGIDMDSGYNGSGFRLSLT